MSKVILDTDEIRLSKYFYKGKQKSDLLVLVEDKDDIPFWQRMFSCVSNKYRQIEVHSLHSAPKQFGKDGSLLRATGKGALMKIEESTLGKNKMIAVDADYDLLIDDYHLYTKRLREGKFIVHTDYYAIENHLINKNTLQALDIWKKLGTDKVQRSWEDILTSFRDAVCHSVKLCIASDAHRIPELKAGSSLSPKLSIDTLRSEVKKLSFDPATYEDDNSIWKTSIEATYSGIDEICSKELAEVDTSISDTDILNYIQGHTLYDYIEKVVRYFFLIDYKQAEEKCKNDAPIDDGPAIGIAVSAFRASIYNGTTDCVRDSIYNGTSLDMTSQDIKNIQCQITTICQP